ncbi:MAG: hypothetical protein CMH30_08905 [Micavibrio sp.]|nr:hypothetical protein [Micavibrio sp.]
MKYLCVFSLCLLLSACIGAGVNSPVESKAQGMFPAMTGIDLQGSEQLLPDAFEGEKNLVTIGFQREDQAEIDTWISYAEELEAADEDFRFYEVPLIYEINPAYRWWINNGMRSGIPSDEARTRTITVYTDREKFFEIMDMSPDRIYTLLLDNNGKILWRGEGVLTEAHKAALKKFI